LEGGRFLFNRAAELGEKVAESAAKLGPIPDAYAINRPNLKSWNYKLSHDFFYPGQ
jgi:hypothetical protein